MAERTGFSGETSSLTSWIDTAHRTCPWIENEDNRKWNRFGILNITKSVTEFPV